MIFRFTALLAILLHGAPLLLTVPQTSRAESETPMPELEDAPGTTGDDRAGAREDAPILGLEEALDRALENNLGLIASRFRPSDARDEVLVEEAAFDPSIFGSASASEHNAAASNSALDDAPTPKRETRGAELGVEKLLRTGATVTIDSSLNRQVTNNNPARNPDVGTDLGLSVRQPLLRNAGREINLAPLARARAEANRSLFELRSDVLDVLSAAEIAYWNLAHARAERELVRSSIALAKSLVEENRQRERLGLAIPLEVVQAETELVAQEENLIQADREIADAEDELRRILGGISFLEEVPEMPAVRDLPEDVRAPRPIREVVRDTIRTDSEAKAREQALEVERINRMLAEDKTRPQVDLFGGVRALGRDDSQREAFGGTLARDGNEWNVGVEMNFPLGFREERARERQAKRAVRREKVRLQDIKQEKALAARDAWRSVRAGKKRIEVTRKSVELNRRSFEQERARLDAGMVAFRQVLEAQRDFDDARSNHLSAIIETMRGVVQLSRVDGTILERNGYTWEDVDSLAQEPETEDHPILEGADKR